MANEIYDKFDKSVMQVIIFGKAASIEAKVDCIYPESLIIGILTIGANEVTSALVDMNVDLEKCRKLFKEELMSKRIGGESITFNYSDLDKISRQVVDACKIADKISDNGEEISIGHMFLALLDVSKNSKRIFEKEGLDVQKFAEVLKKSQKIPTIDGTSTKKTKGSAIEAFCTNVTEMAKSNKLDPIIAREKEIESVITILCRRSKNNPILLGDPGVGKTAIVEGVSQRIVSGSIPRQLLGCQVYSLNLASLVAGTKYRGDFEERIQQLIKEIRDSKDFILFIDEIHTLVGAGSGAGALDASNILKPFLARGELRCIGATTLDDFKKYFKKDGALTRRFQQVMVNEPSKEQTKQILVGIQQRLEEYHGCLISEDAIDATIELSYRYLTDKNFPDKAIDCLDTTCAKFAWAKKDGVSKPVVVGKDVSQVISEQCQIPIEVILWDDHERIKKIEETLLSRVVGQKKAIDTVCRALKNAYSGIRNPNRPIGSFVFGGQSGTGKTYMAKELAVAVFGKDTSFVRLDMSEFSESHSVSKLIGSPPGYVGFSETDVFLDKVRRKPYCIILMDELEKAHPDVLKLFLQVMSDGMMTDAIGNVVNFKNVILIMTGNFGLDMSIKKPMGFNNKAETEEVLDKEVQRLINYCQMKYGSEFINRIDEFVYFAPLNDDELIKIAHMRMEEICGRLANRKCKLVFKDEIYKTLIKMSKGEHGKNATILNRLISKEIEPCISDALLSLDSDFYTITVDVKDGKFVYRKRKLLKEENTVKK